MSQEHTPEGEKLTGFAAQMAQLKPRARIDRDRLMFAAGRQAAAPGLRITNRALLLTNVVCFSALACLLVATNRLDVSAKPNTSVALAPGLETDTHLGDRVSQSFGIGENFRATNSGSSASIALLRELVRTDSLPRTPRPADATILSDQVDGLPTNYSRAVLQQYLHDTPPRL